MNKELECVSVKHDIIYEINDLKALGAFLYVLYIRPNGDLFTDKDVKEMGDKFFMSKIEIEKVFDYLIKCGLV